MSNKKSSDQKNVVRNIKKKNDGKFLKAGRTESGLRRHGVEKNEVFILFYFYFYEVFV